jgi:hypothetical protein
MTTPTTPREPLDLEAFRYMTSPRELSALDRALDELDAEGEPIARLTVTRTRALLARIRELEAERPDWSDADIDRLIAARAHRVFERSEKPYKVETLRDMVRRDLRAAGIVPNVARWRPISEAPKDGTRVLVIDAAHGAVPELAWWGAPGWGQHPACWLTYSHRSDFEDVAAPTHFQPLPAPPTTEAT